MNPLLLTRSAILVALELGLATIARAYNEPAFAEAGAGSQATGGQGIEAALEQGAAALPKVESRVERGVVGPRRAGGGPRFGDQRGSARERREQIQRRIRRLHRQGDHEQAERLERRIHMARRQTMRGRPSGGPRSRDQRAEGPEAADRIRHMIAAARNLREAGLDEQANRIMRRVAQLRGRTPGPGQPPQLDRQLHQLHRRVSDLQHQVEQLREQLKEFTEKDRP